jgi:TonB-linked SusC/RagA family outer membrane protein
MDGLRDQATSTTHAVNVRGGTENTQVFLSGSFMNLKDIQMQSFNERYTIRLNIDQKIGKRINVGGTVNFSDRDWDGGQWMASYWNPLGTPWYSPNGDVTQAGDPAYGIIPQPCGDNLLYSNYLDLTGNKRENHNNNTTISAYASVNLFKGLTYKMTAGSVTNLTNINSFNGHMSSSTSLGTPKASKETKVSRSWSLENNLSYNTKLGEHAIGATIVQTNEKSTYDQEKLSATGIPIESQTWHSLSGATAQATESSYTQWQLQSYLGRVNYTFKDRYLMTASVRYDGSSRLADGHKWVAFPSIALGWRLTEENFLKNAAILDNLKLRAGYGVTGNASVDAYSTVGQIESSRYNWATDVLAPGYIPKSMSNNTLTWEKTKQYNVGIDFGFLRGRISGTIDYYLQHTSDLLMPRTLPSVSGFSSIITNVGETENKGLEISLTTENIKTQKFSWTSTINFSRNKEELVKLNSGLPNDIDNRWFVGYPIFTYYDYVAYPKVWGYSKEDFEEMAKFNANGHSYAPGQLRLVDLNGDYKITDADREIRGSRVPKWTASMENTFTYGPFDLYIFMNSAVGHTIYWDPGNVGDGKLNQTEYLANHYWTPERTDTKFIAPTGSNPPGQITAMFYWKGDYLKINDISLGYTLANNSFLKQIGIQRVRLSVKVLNPFIFTDFPGVDPEGLISNTETVMNAGSQRTYSDPGFLMRTYKFGLNVTF